ncbi:MAG: efflux transporter outer membrane subunit [Rhodocyclaceae bacterium]|nr:MAG: efflux transporter outer membrane subunit [Rhodocyclaceae bacterium]
MSKNRLQLLLVGAASMLSLGLGGCAAVPDLGPKPLPRDASSVAAERSFAGATENWPGDQWWTAYADPQLNALIEEGLQNAPDMAVAAARFRKALGMARQAGAPLAPTIDATGSASLTKQSYNNGFPKEFVPKGWLDTGDLATSIGFDLDLWGKHKAELAAATSEVKAAQYDVRQARLVLATGIADAYADLDRLYDERDIQDATLKVRLASQNLVAQRQRNGLDTRGSVRQADATVATARANLAAAEEAIVLRSNQIAALVGAGPDRGLALARPKLAAPAARGLPAGITTDLVARRPDIAGALARVEAAGSRIKVARADFFPAVRLDALIGLQSLGLDQLINKDSLYGHVGPAISLPIFHGGAISGQYRSVRAGYDEAVASYDATVLNAYREVADAVTSRSMLARRLADARDAMHASQQAYDIARLRYQGGLSTYIDVLNVEDRLLIAREAVAVLEARAFSLDIALVRSLGGGFQLSDVPDPKEDTHG